LKQGLEAFNSFKVIFIILIGVQFFIIGEIDYFAFINLINIVYYDKQTRRHQFIKTIVLKKMYDITQILIDGIKGFSIKLLVIA